MDNRIDALERAESAEAQLNIIMSAMERHCKDDFVVIVDGAEDWSQTIDEFVSFIRLDAAGGKAMLTTKQRELLQAMAECESLSGARYSLRVLNNLCQKGFAERFEREPLFFTNRTIHRYRITDEGRKALSNHKEKRGE